MSTQLDALLSSIRECKTPQALATLTDLINQKKSEATNPAISRALRDAQVYALVWGVFIAAFDNGAAIVAKDNAQRTFRESMSGDGDDENAYATYQRAIDAYNRDSKNAGDVMSAASQALSNDAAAAQPGVDGIDAIADAAAAELANHHIYLDLNSRDRIYPDDAKTDDHELYYARKRQIRNLTGAVKRASSAYDNKYVTKARIAAQLRSSLNRYLLVWRKTTSGGGNPLAIQGILESIDEKNGTFVLRSTTYAGRRDNGSFDDIGEVDTSRTGSGALSAACAPEWRNVGIGEWVRSDAR